MGLRATLLVSATLAVTSCRSGDRTPATMTAAPPSAGEASKPPQDAVPVASGPRFQWAQASCAPSSTFSELLQLSQPELVKKLGSPSSSEQFRLGQRPDEFHVALQNTYPLSVPGNDAIEVVEATWSSEACNLTVWSHQVNGTWQSFEALRWSEGTEF